MYLYTVFVFVHPAYLYALLSGSPAVPSNITSLDNSTRPREPSANWPHQPASIDLLNLLVKKQKKMAATTSTATQTTVWDTDVEKALSKINDEMEVFHARLERMEQARLESINNRRLAVNPESQTKEDGAPACEQWSGSSPSYPPY